MRQGAGFTIDGSYGEGGSALLRTLLQVAAVTQQPITIENVRGATKLAGLTPEDITIARAIGAAASAELSELEPGLSRLTFNPRRKLRNLTALPSGDSNEFANACVIASAIAPVLARGGAYSTLKIAGETHGLASLSYEAFQEVTLRALRYFGLYATPTLIKAGFGRGSGGEILIEVEPSALNGWIGDIRGGLRSLRATVTISDLPDVVGHRGLSHLLRLAHGAGLEIQAEVINVKSRQPGAYITVWAEYENGTGAGTQMGQKGVRIEAVAQQAFQHCFEYMQSGANFDQFTVDQVLFTAAISEGESSFTTNKLTQRLLTQVWAIKQLMPIIITVKGQEGEPGLIKIKR